MTRLKKTALGLLIYFILVLILICYTWARFNLNTAGSGLDTIDGIFFWMLCFAVAYFFILTVWSYRLFKAVNYHYLNFKIELILLFIMGIVPVLYIVA
jgi:hypothetical protein